MSSLNEFLGGPRNLHIWVILICTLSIFLLKTSLAWTISIAVIAAIYLYAYLQKPQRTNFDHFKLGSILLSVVFSWLFRANIFISSLGGTFFITFLYSAFIGRLVNVKIPSDRIGFIGNIMNFLNGREKYLSLAVFVSFLFYWIAPILTRFVLTELEVIAFSAMPIALYAFRFREKDRTKGIDFLKFILVGVTCATQIVWLISFMDFFTLSFQQQDFLSFLSGAFFIVYGFVVLYDRVFVLK